MRDLNLRNVSKTELISRGLKQYKNIKPKKLKIYFDTPGSGKGVLTGTIKHADIVLETDCPKNFEGYNRHSIPTFPNYVTANVTIEMDNIKATIRLKRKIGKRRKK